MARPKITPETFSQLVKMGGDHARSENVKADASLVELIRTSMWRAGVHATRLSAAARRILADLDDVGYKIVRPDSVMKINIIGDDSLNNKLFHVIYRVPENALHIYFNTGTISFVDRSPAELQIFAMMAYAAAAGSDPSDHLLLFAAMRKIGYEIDENMESLTIQSMVANFLVTALGEHKVKVAP